MNPNASIQRFVMSPAGYDNIGAVLAQMGGGFEHELISWKQIKKWSWPVAQSVLFLNCSWRFSFGYGRTIAPILRAFVDTRSNWEDYVAA
jgi:hypothetical protein